MYIPIKMNVTRFRVVLANLFERRSVMDRTRNAVERMLAALDAPAYDLGILSERGMLPGLSNLTAADVLSRLPLLKAHNARGAHIYIRPTGEHRFTVLDDLNSDSVARLAGDGLEPCAMVETSLGNFQAWLKHDDVYPTPLSTFIAQVLGKRYGADPSAADWRRFGRLPGFTNCKPKYRKNNGLYPYVLLRSATGAQYRQAGYLRLEMTKLYQLEVQEREARAEHYSANSFAPAGKPSHSWLSLERFRNAPKFHLRPAAADLAYCVAALSLRMPEDAIATTLDSQYLSRDPNPSRKAAYIKRTLAKARSWAQR
jgi:hypothetical protein